MRKPHSYLLCLILATVCCKTKSFFNPVIKEEHRPQFHFSPPAKWMNDPNGMVYLNGKYHLFYQHYPEGTKWGPMHWGHAVSKDMINWEHQPIALYPDSLGYIFSGSAVYDKDNTSGLGQGGKAPLIAIFTHHDPKGEKAGRKDFQNQSIAFSLDEGKTWKKYAGNPVLKNPGITDFRDPKVSWNGDVRKWIMTLATKDRITFFSSPNLKEWTKESEFGQNEGAHGGVWECPDLFPLILNGKKMWVLLVSINPGGPNKGSATQYFIGDFDGKTFKPLITETKWVDWGTDNYAGVTYSNIGERRIFQGWMSNWQYAESVPTVSWRSAMTLPRDLSLKEVNSSIHLASQPVPELKSILTEVNSLKDLTVSSSLDLSDKIKGYGSQYMLKFESDQLKDFSIVLSNDLGEELVLGYEKQSNQYFVDRSKSGKVDFEKGFGVKHSAPRILKTAGTDLTLIVDVASAELFADSGLNVMTEIFFPNKPFNRLSIRSTEGLQVKNMSLTRIKGIWK
ncbi:glycoside hydrolase family 32 protein [Desertivirga brevis]|uniref:glycoside hydrolase family 32 protein n=1 Tax=Desertivirga brevis TaxID=2810310 RepID=UPI001A96C2C8|nr:glycoside hydrolase family 32 protein [Pedobacter sp. SYSU D00873]